MMITERVENGPSPSAQRRESRGEYVRWLMLTANSTCAPVSATVFVLLAKKMGIKVDSYEENLTDSLVLCACTFVA